MKSLVGSGTTLKSCLLTKAGKREKKRGNEILKKKSTFHSVSKYCTKSCRTKTRLNVFQLDPFDYQKNQQIVRHMHTGRDTKLPVQVSCKRFLYISSQIFLVTQKYFRCLGCPPNTVKTHSVNLTSGTVARLNINLEINSGT